MSDFQIVETALSWFTSNYRTTEEEDAAIAEARQILTTAQARWQPIDTAPQDGTWVLISTWNSVTDVPMVERGFFDPTLGWARNGHRRMGPILNAIAWMPLPRPLDWHELHEWLKDDPEFTPSAHPDLMPLPRGESR